MLETTEKSACSKSDYQDLVKKISQKETQVGVLIGEWIRHISETPMNFQR